MSDVIFQGLIVCWPRLKNVWFDMKQQRSTSVEYMVDYVALISELTHDLDLGFWNFEIVVSQGFLV